MKKNTTAKKGKPSSSKGNTGSSNKRTAKPNNGAYRPRRTKSEGDAERPARGEASEKPERGEWKRPERPEREITERKFAEKTPRPEGKFWDKRNDSERPKTERKRFDADAPAERRDKKEFKSKFEQRERPERPSKAEREDRKPFREKDGERTEPRARIAGKPPVKKTASGRTPYKPPVQKDDSAFHSPNPGRESRGEERSTPSGFNRKKFFDTANERFADKQERKTDRKTRRDEDAPRERSSDRKDADRKPRREDGPRERPESKNTDRKPRREDGPKERFSDRKERDSEKRPSAATREFGKHRPRKGEGEIGEYAPGEMPLNKYIAHSGLCSRRKAVDFVKEGKVTVNGVVVTEPATKIMPNDEVAISNKKINIQKNLVYILLNKPKGYITTTDDPEGRKTVMELIQDATTDERVYPVGRLDRNTSGLLLLTNDGELAQKLAHPKFNIRKIYHVGLDKPVTKADFDQIVAGVTLEDGVAVVDALGYVETNDRKEVGIEIHSGKNRIVRRIFEHLGYEVEKLDRVTYAGLTKKNVNRGKWRFLSEKEVILLKHFK